MNRLACSLLVAGLSLSGTATAQERYADEYARLYGTPGQSYPSQSGYYPSQAQALRPQRGDIAGATYDYARVVRVDPVIGGGYRNQSVASGQNCQYRPADDVYARDGYYGDDRYGGRNDGYYGNDPYRSRNGGYYGNDGYRDPRSGETGRTIATVVGGIAGAVLGSKVGQGSGQYVGTAVGSMVGGMAGRSIYESSQRSREVTRGTVRVCDPIPVGASAGGYYSGNENLDGYDVTYEYAGRTYQTRTDYHPGERIRVRVDVRPE